MTGHYEEFTKMFVAVDCIVFGFDGTTLQVLIGHRKMEPGRGSLSLSGGFVLPNESLDDCANRTLFNLMGMENLYMKQVGAYGQVNRDPGERVLSVAYCALINVKDYNDDLRQRYGMEWMPVNHLPQLWIDHNKMVDDAITLLRKHINTEPLSFNLLPELFTITQLQHVYEAILGKEIDKRNFRKRIKEIEYIEKTDYIDKQTSKRGAALYRFNRKAYEEDPTFKL